LTPGCNRSTPPPTQWILLPAENLTGDASLDWAARAIPVLLEASLEPVPGMQVLRLGRYQDSAGPAATLHCRYERADGGLRVSCWRESSPETWEASGPAPGGGGTSSLAAITAALTQRIHPQARAARPLSDAALESFAQGQYLEAAEQSPAFSAAYTDGVAALIGQGSMDAARKLLDLGERNATQLPPLTNARLDLARSTVSGDATAQIAALEKLDALSSPDPRRLAQLAQLLLSRRRIPDAVAAQQRLTALTPQDASAWNQLGYIRAAAGDLRGAKTALAEYRRIAPATPNALDSLGEVHYQAGEFAAAEKYFREAHAQDPAFNGGQAAIKAAPARPRRSKRASPPWPGTRSQPLPFSWRCGGCGKGSPLPRKDCCARRWPHRRPARCGQMRSLSPSYRSRRLRPGNGGNAPSKRSRVRNSKSFA
jgi:tetratricopeptide (TPR) repeat protein